MTPRARSLLAVLAVSACAPTASPPAAPTAAPVAPVAPVDAAASSAPPPSPRPARTPVHGIGDCTTARCDGAAGPDLVTALSRKAAEARGCYEQALRLDPDLEGRFTLTLHIEATGAVCDALVTNRQLESLDVPACARALFLGATFPPPERGCVLVNLPLSFAANHDGGAPPAP